MRRVHRIAVMASLLLLAAALVGCGTSAPKKGSPEAAVQSLLELRSSLATDPAEYASLVETPMAEALATDSVSRVASQTAPIPEWKTPERTEETTATAKVTVVWKSSKEFANWAKETVFDLRKTGGRWIVIDANAVTGSSDTTAAP